MSSRLEAAFIALLLAVVGFFMLWYKVVYLNIPLVPHAKQSYFALSAEIDLIGEGQPASISLALPSSQKGFRIVSQESEGGDFGYTIMQTEEGQRGEWTKRRLDGKTKIFYKITVVPEPYEMYTMDEAQEDTANVVFSEAGMDTAMQLWDESDRAAAMTLLDIAREHSADSVSFAAQLIQQLNEEQPIESAAALLSMKKQTKISLISALLAHEKIPYRKVRGILLEDRKKGRTLTTMLEVKGAEGWSLFDYKTGQMLKADNFFVWQRGNDALFKTKGIQKPKLSFSITETQVPVKSSMMQESYGEKSEFLNFSLFALPISQQNAFKTMLLVPMGVLIVVILRILIGIRTMGTFMPVLFALAFIQTTLLSGLIMFFVIVSTGLFIRFYLSRLRLLLVARISAVIIVVIGIMSMMSIISYKLGLTQVLTVTFFPMIILSWTIERMSILWEEEGGREVFIQGGGSLLVAVLAYFVMINPYAAYLFFNFPELLLVILSIIIMIGRYTGYRVTELLRFKPLGH